MVEMNEIKERMAKLELNQVQGSKNIEGLHSRLNEIDENYTKEKLNYQRLSKMKSTKQYLGRGNE